MHLSQYSQYELLSYIDPQFPIIFHHDVHRADGTPYMLHWHDAVEVLFFTSGQCALLRNGATYQAREGDMAVFDPNCLHTTNATSPVCEYDCLIVDSGFFLQSGLPIASLSFPRILRDEAGAGCYQEIKKELLEKGPYYKTAAKAMILQFFIYLARNHALPQAEEGPALHTRLDMAKSAMAFIQANCQKPLSLDEICSHVGFSKYYFCRNFKEITGHTAIEYLNIARCRKARLLMATEQLSVSQAAQACQFNHLSYFSKTYKKYMGVLPGAEKASVPKGKASSL